MGTQNSDEHPISEEPVFHLEKVLSYEQLSVSAVQHADEQDTSGSNTVGVKMDSFMNLLERLGLRGSYPKKMTKEDVLAINSLSLSKNETPTENELCNLYLYKLKILDYQARYLYVKPEAISMSLNDDEMIAEDDEDFFGIDDASTESVSSKQEKIHQIHPMDIHMAIFHCSSDFLRQYIFTKLSACQFGLPILVPNPCTEEVEFPLWAMRHIRKSWKSKNGLPSVKYNNRSILNTPVPIVSFIRLGSSNNNSKSQILNGVISKQGHSVFFNRHCRGSTPDSLLMNGVVEIAWYCPGGTKDDIFDDCVAFMNLHGDAVEHPKQLAFLQAVSTVNVLLLSEHPMSEAEKEISQKLSKSPVPLICLFSGKEDIQQSKNPRRVKIAAKKRNQAEFTDELTSNIKQCISLNEQIKSIEDCCEAARKQQFKVDEDQKACQDAFTQAYKITCLLKEVNVSTVKKTFFPLQGTLWHDWCIKDKEQYRLQSREKGSIEQQLSEISKAKTNIRLRQLEAATPLNEFMRSFLECVTSPVHSENTNLYRFQWLRILLDDLSTDALAGLEEGYLSTWRQMRNVSKDKANQLKTRLNNISDKIADTTVGLQHLMREVGQLYEAIEMTAKAKETAKKYASSLPEIGVKMLLSGYPLELMDGDTAHVPLKWIEAVLEKLTETCGDRKVFVLSILGLQSSGKSTLLNTMFGVQFSVSAGRCTRGAFMELIPVDSSIRNQLGYDFVLIVDTEGLRSPELITKLSVSHDNELATFVIGIGDMTVINIMGENASEMHDILQICVQAFLRMKQVKISPSCIFVHQNCAEASAGDKNVEGRRRLLEKLDDIARMAAKEENIEGISGLNDVINFDVETQVFYFKNLLEGDPPMAPPNPSYSQNVQELKTKLLSVACWRTDCNFSALSKFKLRVCDLWRALLQENFVFSFRNTIEMMVYTSLEEKYAAWSWELRKHALKLQHDLHTKIGSDLIQVVDVADFTENFDKVYNPLQSDIEKYFEEDKNKETLVKWKVNINKRIESLKSELIEGTLKKCKELFTSKKNRSELDQRKIKYTEELTRKSKALASKLKKFHLGKKQVKEEFDNLWANWTVKLSQTQPPEESINVEAAVHGILLKKFEKHPNILQEIQDKKRMLEIDQKKDIEKGFLEKIPFFGKRNISPELLLKEQLMSNIQAYINAKEDDKKDFDENFIYEILSDIEKTISSFEKETVLFTNAFKVGLSVYLCLKYISRLQILHDHFKIENHPLTYLQSQRDKYLQSFKNYCKGASSVCVFSDFFCEHIKPEVLKAANKTTSRQIADEMKTNNEAFNGNRSNLERHILKHLANKENFADYVEYIDFPQRYFRRFIQENVESFCADSKKLQKMHKENMETLKRQIITACTIVTTEVAERNGSASMWLTNMREKVGKLIIIDKDELCNIEGEHIEDWRFFKDKMATSLDEMMKDEEIDMDALTKTSTEILLQQLPGCWAQCPFCKAICTNTLPKHDGKHSVEFHHCEALTGRCWDGTNHFAIEFCTTVVCSDDRFKPDGKYEWVPYKTYWDAGDPYDRWEITQDTSEQRYWKWCICKFQKQWEKKYGCKFDGEGKIPEKWKEITKKSALKEL